MKTIFTRFNYLLMAMLFCLVSGNVWGQTTYELVTENSEIAVDGKYIIVGLKGTDAYALGKQNSNNRASCAVSIENSKIITEPAKDKADEVVYEITLKGTNDAWEFYDSVNGTYLVPKTGKSNGLIGASIAAPFKITINSDGKASIVCADPKYERNTLKFNSGNNPPLFACYASGQADVYLYKKIEGEIPKILSPAISLASGTYLGTQSVTLSQENSAAIYYTLNGDDPKTNGTLYSAPIEITETATLKAVAKSGEEYSNVVSADYVIKSLTATLPYEISFKEGLGDWITTTNNEKVIWASDAQYGAKISGYQQNSEVWLISPEVSSDKNILLSFESATKYSGEKLKLYYATDYDIMAATANWIEITDKAIWPEEDSNYEWLSSGNIAVISEQPIRFAFKYTSTTGAAATWQMTNLSIKEGAAQDKVETPTFTPAGGATEVEAVKVEYGTKVTVTSATEGAVVYNGELGVITEPIAITAVSQKIEAYATKEGMTDSDVAEAWYSAYVATPTFSIAGGRVAKGTSVTITSTTAGNTVTYSIDGGAEQMYSAPIVLDETKEYTFKAKATAGGLTSEEATVTYTVYEPVVSTAVLVVKFVKDNVTTWYAMDQVEKDNQQGSGYNMNRRLVEVAEAERQVKATENLVWTIETDENQVYLKAQNGKYLNYTDETKITLADEPYAWTVTENEESNTYTYTNAGGDRQLAYNNSYSAFRCYLISNMNNNYTSDFYLMKAVEELPSSIDSNTVNGTQVYSIDGALIINTDKAQDVQIYSLDGRMVRNIQLTEGENTVSGLAQGVYLMNNQKVVIK